MKFEIIYDFAHEPPPFFWLGIMGILALVGVYFFIFPDRMKDKQGKVMKKFQARLFALWIMGIPGLVFYLFLSEYTEMRNYYTQGQCQTIEGVIENFKSVERNVRHITFTVQGVPFRYSSGTIEYGTPKIMPYLHEGLSVRLYYLPGNQKRGNRILKFEQRP
mgnify:CR=1 FL=1